MVDGLSRLSSAIAAITGLAFILGVFHEFGLNLPFGLLFWPYYQFADVVNSTVHWIPIAALVVALMAAFPIFALVPAVANFRAKLKVLVARASLQEKAPPSLIGKFITFVFAAMAFLAIPVALVSALWLAFLIYPETSAHIIIEDVWRPALVVLFFALVASGAALEYAWNTSVRSVALISFGLINLCLASGALGAAEASVYFRNRADFFHIECNRADLSGDYQIIRKLEYGFVLLQPMKAVGNTDYRSSKLVVLKEDVVVSVSRSVIALPVH